MTHEIDDDAEEFHLESEAPLEAPHDPEAEHVQEIDMEARGQVRVAVAKSEDNTIVLIFHATEVQQKVLRFLGRAASEFQGHEFPDYVPAKTKLEVHFPVVEDAEKYLAALKRAIGNKANARMIRSAAECPPFTLGDVHKVSEELKSFAPPSKGMGK